jgi:hypothetical protein
VSSIKSPEKEAAEIIYNGEGRRLSFQPHQAVQAGLEQAMNLFEITANRHLFALFHETGEELIDLHQSMQDAGVKDGDKLLLGQSTVRGG